MSESKPMTAKGFLFTLPSNIDLSDIDGITVRLTFLAEYSKTPGFKKAMLIRVEGLKVGNYLLTVLKHFTAKAAAELYQMEIYKDTQFDESLYTEVVDLRVSNLAFKALAVLVKTHDEFATMVIETSEMMEFLCECSLNIGNYYLFPSSLESLINLTSTEPRTEAFLVDYNETVIKMAKNLSSYERTYSTGFYSLYYDVLVNIASTYLGRQVMMDPFEKPIRELVGYLDSVFCDEQRMKTAEIICLCSQERENHEWLLGSDVDILPYILLPLAGSEEFTEEENDSLPFDLQYLQKSREENPLVRRFLLKALVNFVRYKEGRVFVREKNSYLILRELHKVEKDEICMAYLEGIVDVLIQNEDELPVTDELGDLTIA